MTSDQGSSAEEDLRAENERLLEFLYLCPVGLAQLGPRGDIELLSSMAAQQLLPIAGGAPLVNLFDVLDAHAPHLRNQASTFREARGIICEGLRIDLSGQRVGRGPEWLSITLVKLDERRLIAVVADITRTVAQERQIHVDAQRFRAIYEGMREAMICTLDASGGIITWNASGERLLGYSPEEAAGKPFGTLSPDAAGELRALLARARDVGWSEVEAWYQRKDGSRFWGDGVVSALRAENGAATGFSVVLRDMTERKRAAERLRELASRDALTGLYNRRHFLEEAERAVAMWKRHGHALSLVLIDADHFKRINDTHGHPAGDDVLQDLASVVTREVRSTDVAARYGGEELVLLLHATPASGARVVAERIRRNVEARVVTHGEIAIRYTVSLGLAALGGGVDTAKDLIAAADAALYKAKDSGRNCTVGG